MPIKDDLFIKADLGKFASLLNDAATNYTMIPGFTRNILVNQHPDSYIINISSLLQYATAYVYRFSKLNVPEANTVAHNFDCRIRQCHDKFAPIVGSQLIEQKMNVLKTIELSKYMLYSEMYNSCIQWIEAYGNDPVGMTIFSIKSSCCICNCDYRTLSGFDLLPEELRNVLATDGMQLAITNFYAV